MKAAGLARRAAVLLCAFSTALPLAAQEEREEVEVDLPPGVAFQVADVAAAPFSARMPFLLAFRNARLAAGRTLRISVALAPSVPEDARLHFEGRSAHGGTCREGGLVPGVFVTLFESRPGAVAGDCDIAWRLDHPGRVRRAGQVAMVLRWKIEALGTPETPFRRQVSRGAPRLEGQPAARGAGPAVRERPDWRAERRRPGTSPP